MQLPAKMHLDIAVDVNYIIVSKVALFQVGNNDILIRELFISNTKMRKTRCSEICLSVSGL